MFGQLLDYSSTRTQSEVRREFQTRIELVCDACPKSPWLNISETPHYVARGAVALAADPDRARFTGESLASWDLGPAYGVTDLNGTQPHMLKYHREVMETGKPADDTGYR